MQKIIPALVKARGTFTSISKNKVNPFHKSKYADLDSVLDAVTPSLTDNGLVLVQTIDNKDGKNFLETRVYHESGEFVSSLYPLPETSDAQKFGAALTYARRYSICAILCVSADDDDDANATVDKPKAKPQVVDSVNQQRVKKLYPLFGVDPRDIRVWVKGQGAESVEQFDASMMHALARWMAATWATKAIQCEASVAAKSFDQHVPGMMQQGWDEVEAIKAWMAQISSSQEAS